MLRNIFWLVGSIGNPRNVGLGFPLPCLKGRSKALAPVYFVFRSIEGGCIIDFAWNLDEAQRLVQVHCMCYCVECASDAF